MSVRRRGHQLVLCLSALAIAVPSCLVALGVPAASSELAGHEQGEDGEQSAADGQLKLLPTTVRVPPPIRATDGGLTSDAQAMWTWPERRIGYVLKHVDYRSADQSNTLISFSLDDGQEIASKRVSPGAYDVREEQVAIDRDKGRVFLPHANLYTPRGPIDTAESGAPQMLQGQSCVSNAPSMCISGVYIVDATTLEPLGDIPVRVVTAEGTVPGMHRLVAMSYAPPRQEGDADKLLLLIRESSVTVTEAYRRTNTMPHYLVQLDLESRRQDWIVRVDGCRTERQYVDTGEAIEFGAVSHQAALFRLRSMTEPGIVVGCSTGSAFGSVIARVPLDQAGNPYPLPVSASTSTGAVQAEPQASPGAHSADSLRSRAVLNPGQSTFFGPEKTFSFVADPQAEQFLLRVVDAGAEVWWVFNARKWAILGTVGIGLVGRPAEHRSLANLDPDTGRLYVLAQPRPNVAHGLYVVDTRRVPVPQALVFPDLGPALWPRTSTGDYSGAVFELTVEPAAGKPFPHVYVADKSGCLSNCSATDYLAGAPTKWRVVQDRLPVSIDATLDEKYAGRTLDIDEREGATGTSLDGAARGYGSRLLMVGGVDAATRLGPFDPPGQVWQLRDHAITKEGSTTNLYPTLGSPRSPCTDGNRDVVLGFVGPRGPAIVDSSGSRGGAEPVVVDSATRADTEAAVSRCGAITDLVADWEGIWGTALFGRPPVDEPTVVWPFGEGDSAASCISSGQASSSVGDPVAGAYAAKVDCADEESAGYAYARGVSLAGVEIGQALSSFRIYRDPGRGVVSRVESVARAVSIPGLIRIDSVRGVAESWANGRQFTPPDTSDGQIYNPNCDFERTAGTCFTRHVFGVWTPGYSCGPCGDESTPVDRISKGMGAYGAVRLRDPDPKLAKGADNGFIAAITKPDSERFADLVLNNDLLQTMVPAVEIIRYAPPNRTLTGGGPRGRQIIQLAGVEVSSSYGISCLLVYDEVSNTCAAQAEPPGSITVNLADPDGKALAGGAFEVRQDVDTDGVVGLKDALLPNGACVTTDDGVGTCKFETLQPGSYLVSQVAAPPGYGKVAEPFVVELASGEARTVTFQNTSNVSTIAMSASDEGGKPVSGAQFAVYGDPDSDGKVAADAQPAATCTTDASGSCAMQVPAGSYVLVQTSAPGGLEPIEPVAFTFASGGQTAAVGVVNYPAGGLPQPEPAAAPVYSDPPAAVVTETVGDYTPTTQVADEPQVSIPDAVGGTIVRVIQAPGDALRLLSRDPKQAVAWTASLMLFVLAAMAIRRRQQATELIQARGQV